MPTPITAFTDAAAKYGDVDPNDMAAVETWFTEELPTLPAETIEQVLHELLEQDGQPPTRRVDPSYPKGVMIPSLRSSPAALPPSLVQALLQFVRSLAPSKKRSE